MERNLRKMKNDCYFVRRAMTSMEDLLFAEEEVILRLTERKIPPEDGRCREPNRLGKWPICRIFGSDPVK